jgi:hypothetical protein
VAARADVTNLNWTVRHRDNTGTNQHEITPLSVAARADVTNLNWTNAFLHAFK